MNPPPLDIPKVDNGIQDLDSPSILDASISALKTPVPATHNTNYIDPFIAAEEQKSSGREPFFNDQQIPLVQGEASVQKRKASQINDQITKMFSLVLERSNEIDDDSRLF
mmetsp:Transcript_39085/g.59582  ORF Transcript_39085/g.59582 Transcript_39085/m.59582 type:complete len:110 (+) Transcript_39085:1358-1687(+)